MIIVDQALEKLEKENKPIRIGLIGAGFAGRGFATRLLEGIPGMRLVAICNRTVSYAEQAYTDMGIKNYAIVDSKSGFDLAVKYKKHVITTNPDFLTGSDQIDVIVEATGTIEYAAHVVMDAIKHKKHVVLINAELDTTLGPILKKYADKAGVVYTQADGDQPAVIMNLMRYVKSLGFSPKVLGNIKSLLDHKRTPDTQREWSAAHYQRPAMPTSFADGAKISYEMATVANATGFGVGKRGMFRPEVKRVEDAPKVFSDEMIGEGIVDYIMGAEPSFGVFVLATTDNEVKKRYMSVYKMTDGPLYTFYVPYHLSPLEAPVTVARAVLFGDVALAPKQPVCDVVAVAKRDLKAGEILDGVGGFCCYGEIENTSTMKAENLIPLGFIEGCKLRHDIAEDMPVTYDDVIIPEGRLIDTLKKEQDELFGFSDKNGQEDGNFRKHASVLRRFFSHAAKVLLFFTSISFEI